MELWTTTAAKVKTVKYINGILTHEVFDNYIPMRKICVDIIVPQILLRGERAK